MLLLIQLFMCAIDFKSYMLGLLTTCIGSLAAFVFSLLLCMIFLFSSNNVESSSKSSSGNWQNSVQRLKATVNPQCGWICSSVCARWGEVDQD